MNLLLKIVIDKLKGLDDIPDWFLDWEDGIKPGLTASFVQLVYLPLLVDATVSQTLSNSIEKRICTEVTSSEICGKAVLEELIHHSSRWNEGIIAILESLRVRLTLNLLSP